MTKPFHSAAPGPESVHRTDNWYTVGKGQPAGPHSFEVLAELARAGVLRRRDSVWSPETEGWIQAADVPNLFDFNNPRRSASGPRPVSRSAARACLWAGLVWAALVWGVNAVADFGLLDLRDLALETQILVFGTIVLTAAAVFLLPAVWRASEDAPTLPGKLATGTLRLAVAFSGLVMFTMSLVWLVNFPDRLLVAFGVDPFDDFEVWALEGDLGVVLNGSLGGGAAGAVSDALADMPQARIVHLNSPGGWVAEGLYLRDLIVERNLATYTSEGCYSACVIAFIGGRSRTIHVDARLGFHAAGGEWADPVYLEGADALFSDDLRALGVSEGFIRRAESTAHSDMWFPSNAELLANHLIDGESRVPY